MSKKNRYKNIADEECKQAVIFARVWVFYLQKCMSVHYVTMLSEVWITNGSMDNGNRVLQLDI